MKPQDYAVVYNLREIYHELGLYELKIVLDPKLFKNSHLSEMTIVDSDGNGIKHELRKWGRKMSCTFNFDQSVPDGVCTVSLALVDDEGRKLSQRFSFWTIK